MKRLLLIALLLGGASFAHSALKVGGVGGGGSGTATDVNCTGCVSTSELEKDTSQSSTINTSTNPVDWSQLKGVPAGLADGTDAAGGASALAVDTGTVSGYGVPTSSPTAAINFNSTQFSMALTGSGTAYISLDPSITTGSLTTRYIPLANGDNALTNSPLYYGAIPGMNQGEGIGFNTSTLAAQFHLYNATTGPRIEFQYGNADEKYSGFDFRDNEGVLRGTIYGANVDLGRALGLGYSGTDALTIKSDLDAYFSGNVGIATGTPQAALDVQGNIVSSGTVTATAFVGDGSLLTGVSGSGDVVKSATQTFTGGNTFNSWTTFAGTVTFSGPSGSTSTLSGSGTLLGVAPVSGSTWTFSSTALKDPSGNVVAKATGTFIFNISTTSLAQGTTWQVGVAPDDSAITITRVRAASFSVAASTINFSLWERSTPNGSNTTIFSNTVSSGSWTGTTITSFNDASIAAGNGIYISPPASGATFQAGTPTGLRVLIDYLYAQ